MGSDMSDLMIRKLMTTFVISTLASIVLPLFSWLGNDGAIGADQVMADIFYITLVYNMYIGTVIFIYGNAVSLMIEWFRCKWFARWAWLGVLLHGLFGMGLGLLTKSWFFLLIGVLIALAYGALDWWLEARMLKGKRVAFIMLLPVVLYAVTWGVLDGKAPPEPPFSPEEAVAFATQGKGTAIQAFPDHIGTWRGTIEDYQVVRETSAEETAGNCCIVTFTETWRKGNITNSQFFAYEVDRDSMTFFKSEGANPPYASFNLKE
ncbi:hypothetical protein FHS16_003387 [Paenibacillus endophyticus]|uniref:Uncharacterized protein n=1 Tax=Paenibacillus endophyticus TaxID=1294268 RepID=A0A7W5GB18_9BACL|nr:hypothetical protein [Paenibacillus endophyticus]MBB3153325.1 hypothetical protein [Paenibacillus endophyticus]